MRKNENLTVQSIDTHATAYATGVTETTTQ